MSFGDYIIFTSPMFELQSCHYYEGFSQCFDFLGFFFGFLQEI
jgi:hypothetical protein